MVLAAVGQPIRRRTFVAAPRGHLQQQGRYRYLLVGEAQPDERIAVKDRVAEADVVRVEAVEVQVIAGLTPHKS